MQRGSEDGVGEGRKGESKERKMEGASQLQAAILCEVSRAVVRADRKGRSDCSTTNKTFSKRFLSLVSVSYPQADFIQFRTPWPRWWVSLLLCLP